MLTSAPSSFERLMETVLRGLQWKTLLVYLDDVIIFSKDFKSHLERLEEVLLRFEEANLKLKAKKCHFLPKRSATWDILSVVMESLQTRLK